MRAMPLPGSFEHAADIGVLGLPAQLGANQRRVGVELRRIPLATRRRRSDPPVSAQLPGQRGGLGLRLRGRSRNPASPAPRKATAWSGKPCRWPRSWRRRMYPMRCTRSGWRHVEYVPIARRHAVITGAAVADVRNGTLGGLDHRWSTSAARRHSSVRATNRRLDIAKSENDLVKFAVFDRFSNRV